MSWPTSADGLWYVFDGQVQIPVDPSTGAPILLLRPQGGMGIGIPAIADGPPGKHAEIQEAINFTALHYDDPTADSASWTTVTPPTDTTPGVYKLNLALHQGSPGASGTTAIDLTTISGTKAIGSLIKVNSAQNGFNFDYERVGECYNPATVNNTTAGNANSTLAIVNIPLRNFDRRIRVHGYTIVTQNGGSNVVVDFLARLGTTGITNPETSGNIIGRCAGVGGTERLTIVPAPPAGSADTFDKVLAGNTGTVYFRTEQQGGSNTYTTSNSTTLVSVEVFPVL
jgi:hypothetical protein